MSASWQARRPATRLARWLICLAALLVRRDLRAPWRDEWVGELWELDRRGASSAALLRFGLAGAVDAVREVAGSKVPERDAAPRWAGLGQDLRMAVRRLLRAPVFATVTVLVLALGIGANTALFGALRAALLAPPPYPDPGRLVVVDLLSSRPGSTEPADTLPWSYPKFEMVGPEADFLTAAAGYMERTITLAGAGDPERLTFELVSPAYFDLLGVTPAVGRLLTETEAPPAVPRSVVLSHGLWVQRFGSDPRVVGRTVELEGEPFEVVGVARRGFGGLSGSAQGWVSIGAAPVVMDPRRLEREQSHWFRVVGRLRTGLGLEAARQEAAALGPGLTERFSAADQPSVQGVALTPLTGARVNATTRLAVAAAGAGAALLLLIATANVAGLFLVRAAARRGDVAVRAALGAGRARLAREVLAESLLLAMLGGAAGIGLAVAGEGAVRWAVSQAVETTGSRGIQFIDPAAIGLDATVLAAGLVLALLVGLAFGVVPARAASRADLSDALAGAGRGAGTGRRGSSDVARGALVAGQLALTLVLLSGGGLMVASFARLDAVRLGVRPEGVLTARYELGPEATPADIRSFESSLVRALKANPGVAAAAVGVCSPLAGLCDITGVRQIDAELLDQTSGSDAWIHTQSVSPGFFETAGIPIVSGRGLPSGLGSEDPPVVVIDEAAAERYFPGVDPVGHRIAATHFGTPEGVTAEIVGVVGSVAYQELEAQPAPTLYFSSDQVPAGWGQILVRAASGVDPATLADAVRQSVLELRPGMPVNDVTTLEARKAMATARTRVVMGLLLAFGLTALVLSAVGLWALVAYSVSRRTREMGLRIALGARPKGILGLVATRPVALAAAGAAVGLIGAVLLTRYLEALLFEVEPGDPTVMASACAVLLAVAAMAAVLPALGATRVDPADSLRAE